LLILLQVIPVITTAVVFLLHVGVRHIISAAVIIPPIIIIIIKTVVSTPREVEITHLVVSTVVVLDRDALQEAELALAPTCLSVGSSLNSF
jgi:hypothetical protein